MAVNTTANNAATTTTIIDDACFSILGYCNIMATADNNVPYDNKDSIAASAAGHFVEFIAIIEDFPLNFL